MVANNKNKIIIKIEKNYKNNPDLILLSSAGDDKKACNVKLIDTNAFSQNNKKKERMKGMWDFTFNLIYDDEELFEQIFSDVLRKANIDVEEGEN